MAKLVKWRFFFYAEKFIDFNRDIITKLLDQMRTDENMKLGWKE